MKQHRQYSFVYWFPQPFNEFALINNVLLINIEKTDKKLQVKCVLNIKKKVNLRIFNLKMSIFETGYSQQKCF